MTSKPLIIKDGLLQVAGPERVRLNLNVGEPVVIDAISNTVTINAMFHVLQAVYDTDVENILGGDEGDVILLKGSHVKLKTGGNIKITVKLTMSKAVLLLYTDGAWIPISS